ncbi:MAG: GIY-YIG nuclease family protein [Saprospiraceae bacterium]|nr:GIY-YIG nuclease family protein [Saprospiraceae bacterium]
MERLLEIGFIKVGHWASREDKMICNLDSHHSNKSILYSFISNGEVKYIGKTIMSLSRRMYGYQNPGKSQSTNIRVNEKIKDCIAVGEAVDIFILVDNGLLKFGNFQINLAAGLEDTMIYEISPDWNFNGKSKIEEDDDSSIDETTDLERSDQSVITIESFEITLGKAYYNQGFFNVKMEYSDLFGGDRSEIQIQLGENKDLLRGYVNRTANMNGTPRIMIGKRFAEWIQSRFEIGDVINVDILTPSLIKLNGSLK